MITDVSDLRLEKQRVMELTYVINTRNKISGKQW